MAESSRWVGKGSTQGENKNTEEEVSVRTAARLVRAPVFRLHDAKLLEMQTALNKTHCDLIGQYGISRPVTVLGPYLKAM